MLNELDLNSMNIYNSFFASAAVRRGITETVTRALHDPEVKSVVICGENGVFCGGKV